MTRLRRLLLITCVAGQAALAACAAQPDSQPQEEASESSVRLYVLDCGFLQRGETNPGRYGLTLDQVENTSFADPCYLVAHPSGTLLWEAGIIPDALIEPEGTDLPRGPGNDADRNRATRTLRSQLEEIGYGPSTVTHVAVSHRHADHIANLNDYAGSTWLVQRPGHAAMFATDARDTPTFANYSALEQGETVLLDGDHDVFGDGSVVIKSTPGHTEGHQSLFVRLANTGPVLLSGDLYHYPAERTLGTVPDFELDPDATIRSRAGLEDFLQETGAQLWIQHDIAQFESMRMSPAYYD